MIHDKNLRQWVLTTLGTMAIQRKEPGPFRNTKAEALEDLKQAIKEIEEFKVTMTVE